MFIIIMVLIILYIIMFFISKNKYSHVFTEYPKKENPFLILYPFAVLITDLIRGMIGKVHDQANIARFEKLYPKGNGKDEYRRFILHRNSVVLTVIFLFLVLSILSEAAGSRKGILNENRITRPVGGRSSEAALLVYSEELEGKEVDIAIRPKRLKGEELENYFEQVKEMLEEEFLNQNESVDYVTSSLYFVEEISDANMTIEWRPENTMLINLTGRVNNEDIDNEGVITYVNLILTYYKEECREYSIPLCIYPPDRTEEETLLKEINKALTEAEEHSLYEDTVALPEEIQQKKLLWGEKKENTVLLYFIYGAAAAAVIYYVLSNEVKKKEKLREKQMMLDYSNIISKFTLYLAAGMTIRGAWECIASEYEKRQERIAGGKKREMHYAYEEMLTAMNEMKVGISESRAYENFGRRCMLIPYIKFTSIIVQNLKKGTSGILPLLEMEKRQAFSERKELAKRLGEEAGTKLQIPLMIYLVIVLFIVLVPAFLSL